MLLMYVAHCIACTMYTYRETVLRFENIQDMGILIDIHKNNLLDFK